MDLVERLKNHKLVIAGGWVLVGFTSLGTLAGMANDILDFAERAPVNSGASWFVSQYTKLSGWLAVEVSLPMWAFLPLLALATLAAIWLQRTYSKLATATAELEELKNPEAPAPVVLNEDQQSVLFWSRYIYDARNTGQGPLPTTLSDASKLPLTTVESALRSLQALDIVQASIYRNISLTPAGMVYMEREGVAALYNEFRKAARWRPR